MAELIKNPKQAEKRQTNVKFRVIQRVVKELLLLDKYIDIVIPRGGKSLIERISKDSKIQVIKHLDGICHVYIDEFADKKRAVDITMNSKTQRLGTCNTLETLLVNKKICWKKIIFAPRSGALAHLGSQELRAVKIPASYDA